MVTIAFWLTANSKKKRKQIEKNTNISRSLARTGKNDNIILVLLCDHQPLAKNHTHV